LLNGVFESILKKCKFINNIVINFIYFNRIINSEEIIELIIKNCNNLKLITLNFNKISDELIEKFGLKFVQKLREIRFIRDFESNYTVLQFFLKFLQIFLVNGLDFANNFGFFAINFGLQFI
jgi:hypothetical protein